MKEYSIQTEWVFVQIPKDSPTTVKIEEKAGRKSLLGIIDRFFPEERRFYLTIEWEDCGNEFDYSRGGQVSTEKMTLEEAKRQYQRVVSQVIVKQNNTLDLVQKYFKDRGELALGLTSDKKFEKNIAQVVSRLIKNLEVSE